MANTLYICVRKTETGFSRPMLVTFNENLADAWIAGAEASSGSQCAVIETELDKLVTGDDVFK